MKSSVSTTVVEPARVVPQATAAAATTQATSPVAPSAPVAKPDPVTSPVPVTVASAAPAPICRAKTGSETRGSCSLSAATCQLRGGEASAVRAKSPAIQAEEAQRGVLQHRRRTHAFRRRLGAKAEARPPRRRIASPGEGSAQTRAAVPSGAPTVYPIRMGEPLVRSECE